MSESTWTQKQKPRVKTSRRWAVSSHPTPAPIPLSSLLQWFLNAAPSGSPLVLDNITQHGHLLSCCPLVDKWQHIKLSVPPREESFISPVEGWCVYPRWWFHPAGHRFQEHQWARGQIIALTLGHSASLHMGSEPDTSWLLPLALWRSMPHSAIRFHYTVQRGHIRKSVVVALSHRDSAQLCTRLHTFIIDHINTLKAQSCLELRLKKEPCDWHGCFSRFIHQTLRALFSQVYWLCLLLHNEMYPYVILTICLIEKQTGYAELYCI